MKAIEHAEASESDRRARGKGDSHLSIATLAMLLLPFLAGALWFTIQLEPHALAFVTSVVPLALAGAAVLLSERDARTRLALHVARVEAELRRRLRGYDPAESTISRRYFLERLEQEIRRSQRYNLSMSLLVVKIRLDPDMEQATDAWAAISADVVSTAARLLRTEDTLGYLGEFEFAICLPHTAADGAQVVVERLESALPEYGPRIGLSEINTGGFSPEELIKAARINAERRARTRATSRTWNEDLAVA